MKNRGHSSTKTRQALLALAYGLYLASTSALLWGGYVGLLGSAYHQEFTLTTDFLVRNAAFPLTLIGGGLVAFYTPERVNRFSILFPCCLFSMGAVIIATLGQDEGVSFIATILIGFSFGMGSGMIFCLFQRVLSNENVFSAGMIVILAAGISSVLYFVVSVLPDEYSFWVTAVVLFPVSLTLLYVMSRNEDFAHPMYLSVPKKHIEQYKSALEELWSPLVCIAFSAFIVGLIRAQGILNFAFTAEVNTLNMIGLLISAIILAFLWRYHYAKITMTRVYQVLFPITATVYLLLPFLGSTYITIFVSVVFLVFSVASSLMVITCIRAARKKNIHPVCIYGFFAGCVYAVSLLGAIVGLLLTPEGSLGSSQLLIIALLALYILTFVLITQRRTKSKNEEVGQVISNQEISTPTYLIEEQCAEFSKKYGLSRREDEVLILLAKGRDTPYIAEELFISKNTVRTHTKNIFVKTGVHSKQELMSAVEAIRL